MARGTDATADVLLPILISIAVTINTAFRFVSIRSTVQI